MKNMLKHLIASFALIILFSSKTYAFEKVDMSLYYDGQNHRYYADEIFLMIDGRDIRGLTMPPVIINDYTMVPAREVFEQLGAVVEWSGDTGAVFISYGRDLVVLQIDNNVAYLNEEPIVMDAAPKIINDKTMIPVRFAAESLGFKVGWDPDNRIVSVDSYYEAPQTPTDLPVISSSSEPDYSGQINEIDSTENLDQPLTNVDDVIPAIDVSTSDISAASYNETTIDSIVMADNGRHAVDIIASSEISKVTKLLLPDNRLVLDFYGAEMKLTQKEYTPPIASAYKLIRAAQNALTPEKITRVVLELEDGVSFSVSISPDRKSVSVDFERTEIYSVNFNSNGVNDFITITGSRAPSVNIMLLSQPDRLIIDMPYSSIGQYEAAVNGRFGYAVRYSQFDAGTARIVIDLNGRVKHTTSVSGDSITITMEEPTYKNISYDNASNTVMLQKDAFSPLSASSISKTDRYNNGQYIFTLPGNYQSVYGYGEYEVNDENVRFISIETIDNMTHVTVNERKVFEAVITEDNQYIYISLKNPKEIYSRVLVIDPGHGGSDPGTNGSGVEEKVITLDIAQRVIDLINADYYSTGIKVYSTRLDDTYVSLFDRAPYANEIGDMFVSVHINSAAPNAVPNGTETYYYPHDNDSATGFTTKQMADIFHKNLLSRLNLNDRKVKENKYVVLRDTLIPSVLCEIGFISNEEEAAKILDPNFRQMAAQAIYESIIESFGVYAPRR